MAGSCLDCLVEGDSIALGDTVHRVDGVKVENGARFVLVGVYGWVPAGVLARNGWRLRSSVELDAAVVVGIARELYRGEG